MIRRDRNHPSVVMWSIGNEIHEQRDGEGCRRSRRQLADIAHERRPDAPGEHRLRPDRGRQHQRLRRTDRRLRLQLHAVRLRRLPQSNPRMPLIGSETSSCPAPAASTTSPSTNDKDSGRLNSRSRRYDFSRPPGRLPRRRVQRRRTRTVRRRRVRLDRLRLPRRADAVLRLEQAARARRTGRRAAPTSASWTSAASRRTATTSTRASGPRSRWSTFCRTGTGRDARASRCR